MNWTPLKWDRAFDDDREGSKVKAVRMRLNKGHPFLDIQPDVITYFDEAVGIWHPGLKTTVTEGGKDWKWWIVAADYNDVEPEGF